MSRGVASCLLFGFAALMLVCQVGCPEPTQPVAKTNTTGPSTTPPEKTTTPTEPQKATPAETPDDPDVVKDLKDAGHKLKTDDAGNVVEVTLLRLGNPEKTTALLEQVAKLPNVTRLKAD